MVILNFRYLLQNDCELNVADSDEDYISYAIALPQIVPPTSTIKSGWAKEKKHSGSIAALKVVDSTAPGVPPSKDLLNAAIMKLTEKDILHKFEMK